MSSNPARLGRRATPHWQIDYGELPTPPCIIWRVYHPCHRIPPGSLPVGTRAATGVLTRSVLVRFRPVWQAVSLVIRLSALSPIMISKAKNVVPSHPVPGSTLISKSIGHVLSPCPSDRRRHRKAPLLSYRSQHRPAIVAAPKHPSAQLETFVNDRV